MSMLLFSCDRNFVARLDAQHRIWCILSWDRPFVFDHAVFDATRPDTTVVQVESGWAFGAARLWFSLRMESCSGSDGCYMGDKDDARALAHGGEIQCYTWTIEWVEPLGYQNFLNFQTCTGAMAALPSPLS